MRILESIETARRAIGEAEDKLREIAEEHRDAPRRETTVAGLGLRGAFSRLRAAKAKLLHLETLHATEQTNAARDAIRAAEEELDVVLGERVATVGAEEWVGEAIEAAFAKLRVAKQVLVDLNAVIARGAKE